MSIASPEPDPIEPAPDDSLPDPERVGVLTFAVDVSERAIATYLEAFVSLLIVAGTFGLPTVTAAAVAAIPAGLSLVKAALTRFLLTPARSGAGYVADLAERTVATYLESLVALLAAADTLGMSAAAAAAVSAIPAALSVIKGAIARFLGNRESAALVPARLLKSGA